MSDFIYPSNYVPSAGPRRPDKKGEIGGDLPYQNLASYRQEDGTVRRSGRIGYRLTALSPLFIPDPEQTSYYRTGAGDSDYHRVMDFFNVDGYLAIPNTSLQGMCRSVVEAITNSAFGVFTPSQKRHAFRKLKNLAGHKDLTSRKWGRWTPGPNGTFFIEPLEAVKIQRSAFDSAFGLTTDETARAALYNGLRRQPYTKATVEVWLLHTSNKHVREFSLTYTGTPTAGTVFSSTVGPSLSGSLALRPGTPYSKNYKTQVKPTTGAVVKGPLILEIKDALGIKDIDSGPWVVDYKTVLGIPNVKTGTTEDRICWLRYAGHIWDAKEAPQPAILWPRAGWEDMEPGQRAECHYITALLPQSGRVLVSEKAIADFRSVNSLRNGTPVATLPDPGEIVRYLYGEESKEVAEFGRPGLYKTLEEASVADLADVTPEIKPERKNTVLSPASRLFGWILDSPGNSRDLPEDKSPVAGRVSFGVAWSDCTTAQTRLTPLPILSSPSPGYYPFSLRPADNSLNASVEPAYFIKGSHGTGWWHTPGRLRGRKFYLHHPDAIFDPTAVDPPHCAPNSPEAACQHVAMTEDMVKDGERLESNQNSTAAILPPGATFQGEVEFDGLADYEIGMLLWALSLADSPLKPSPEDRKRAHKLGLGRPHGLGSVRLEIGDLALWDPTAGWRDASLPTETPVTVPAEAERFVRIFKTWMLTGRNRDESAKAAEFDRMPFFRDLCHILRTDLAGETPVQYYPPNLPAYEGYEYFVAQRKKRPDHRAKKVQKEQPLRTPEALSQGYCQYDDPGE